MIVFLLTVWSGFWVKLTKSLGVDPSTFLLTHQTRLEELITREITRSPDVGRELVKTVVRVCPVAILPFIVANFTSVLSNKAEGIAFNGTKGKGKKG